MRRPAKNPSLNSLWIIWRFSSTCNICAITLDSRAQWVFFYRGFQPHFLLLSETCLTFTLGDCGDLLFITFRFARLPELWAEIFHAYLSARISKPEQRELVSCFLFEICLLPEERGWKRVGWGGDTRQLFKILDGPTLKADLEGIWPNTLCLHGNLRLRVMWPFQNRFSAVSGQSLDENLLPQPRAMLFEENTVVWDLGCEQPWQASNKDLMRSEPSGAVSEPLTGQDFLNAGPKRICLVMTPDTHPFLHTRGTSQMLRTSLYHKLWLNFLPYLNYIFTPSLTCSYWAQKGIHPLL